MWSGKANSVSLVETDIHLDTLLRLGSGRLRTENMKDESRLPPQSCLCSCALFECENVILYHPKTPLDFLYF